MLFIASPLLAFVLLLPACAHAQDPVFSLKHSEPAVVAQSPGAIANALFEQSKSGLGKRNLKALKKLKVSRATGTIDIEFVDGEKISIAKKLGKYHVKHNGNIYDFDEADANFRLKMPWPRFFDIVNAPIDTTQDSLLREQRMSNGKMPGSGAARIPASFDTSSECQANPDSCLPPSWLDCQLDVMCSSGLEGFWESIGNAISNFFEHGSQFNLALALGSAYGLTMEALTAGVAALADVGYAASIVGVYGAYGIFVGVVFVAGVAAGTFIYDNYGNVIWSSWG